jgi:hypothetical protein
MLRDFGVELQLLSQVKPFQQAFDSVLFDVALERQFDQI